MKTLLLDNYDSFTFNLFQRLAQASGSAPCVYKNDAATWPQLEAEHYDNIVISPGPGHPERPSDFGVCRDAILHAQVPLLGVCLGHQGIVTSLGGRVALAPAPMHGRLSWVHHDGSALFDGIPSPFAAVRYHSLVATELPPGLCATAWTDEGLVMAVRHRDRPLFGVQFHPESIACEGGERLLQNFLRLAEPRPAPRAPTRPRRGRALHTRSIDVHADSEALFLALYGGASARFWLDTRDDQRFSYMGDAAGPNAAILTYDHAARTLNVCRGPHTEIRVGCLFSLLQEVLDAHTVDAALPFDLQGGLVGYFGYEMKAGPRVHRAPTPDAAFILADRLVVFDHHVRNTTLVSLSDDSAWFDATEAKIRAVSNPPPPPPAAEKVRVTLGRGPARYAADIERCLEEIRRGESYEVCLTNQLHGEAQVSPLQLYRRLRRVNPAPYGAFVEVGGVSILSSSPERFLKVDHDGNVESKPMKGTRRRAAASADDERCRDALACSEKDRAENLMIVDLVRNDLGIDCEVGSVSVPKLMEVETYATVHQMVSTVRGRLRRDRSVLDAVRSAFPPGSMTGAPKRRTLEILDALEGEARGIYSGALGYLGFGGAAELCVVIRTIVLHGTRLQIGTGGAIVALSDADQEIDETLVKLAAPLRALVGSDERVQHVLADLRTAGVAEV
jgi:para-aminobenzoate synthetase